MRSSYIEHLHVAVDAAKAAGSVIRNAFLLPKDVHHKGAVDLVTETDQACEELILQRIKQAFPDHLFIGEETSAAQGFTTQLTDAPTWMVDPLDGTTNFVHSFPFVCTSIALVVDRVPVVGVVFNPVLNELFTAIRGDGAYLNGAKISASSTSQLSSALVGTEIGTTRDPETVDAIFSRIRALTAASRSIRCSGSCAVNLCSVAVGRLDAFFEIGFGGCWDVAAGALIVEEAGGCMLDPAGGPFGVMSRRVLAANQHLGPAVAHVLAACPTSAAEPSAPPHS